MKVCTRLRRVDFFFFIRGQNVETDSACFSKTFSTWNSSPHLWLLLRNWEIRVSRVMFIYAKLKPQIASVCKTIKFLSIPSLMGFFLHLPFFLRKSIEKVLLTSKDLQVFSPWLLPSTELLLPCAQPWGSRLNCITCYIILDLLTSRVRSLEGSQKDCLEELFAVLILSQAAEDLIRKFARELLFLVERIAN